MRVSTPEQEESGYSLDFQKKAIVNYAETHNLKLSDTMILEEIKPASTIEKNNIDNSLNRSLSNRPILKDILSQAQLKKFNHLIIFSRDRLTRNFEQFVAMRFLLQKNNITIHYCKEGENITSSDEKITRFLDMILANVAELEANTISVRVRSGLMSSVINGCWPGGLPPFGYRCEKILGTGKKKSPSKLVPIPEEKNIVEEIFYLYNLGYGYREIARKMDEKYHGYKRLINDKILNVNWTKSKIECIIKNEVYTGLITWDRRGGRRHPGKKLKPIYSKYKNNSNCFIDKDEWINLQEFRKEKHTQKDTKYFNTPFLLKDKLYCGKCNSKLKTKNYGKNHNGYRRVYRCPSTYNNKSEMIINKDTVEKMVITELIKNLEYENTDTLWEPYIKNVENLKSNALECINTLKLKIEATESLIKNIEELTKDDLGNEFIERLQHLYDLLQRTKAQYKSQIESNITTINKKYISNKEDLRICIKEFLKMFFSHETNYTKQRMLMNNLIEKVVMNKSGDGIKEILFNVPQTID